MPRTSATAVNQSRKINAKLVALNLGKELPLDPYAMAHGEVGQVPPTDERAVLALARAYQREEDPDYVSVSWPNQVKAAAYFNAHELIETLDEVLRVGGPSALE